MEIIIAPNSGFCYGVRRALRMVEAIRAQSNEPIYTLGELIHNPQIIQQLEKKGIHSINNPDEISHGVVIIRSHGASPEIFEKLNKPGISIKDATCPHVKKIQNLVKELALNNEEVIICGNARHPETQGLLGYCASKGRVVETEAEAQRLPRAQKRAVLAQSTQDLTVFQKVISALVEKTEHLEVYNTICGSTLARQKSTSALARKVDSLIIIGGRNSSNTNKLFRIAKKILPRTYFVEYPSEINLAMIKEAQKIGLSGGASTPPEALHEAVAVIKNLYKSQQSKEEKVVPCQR
ncbi:MAG: 4-hydroxy-3-methylbut-2-enyl diphosphate reductase [Candidatus Aminicenantes bacterium]|nr:MAG: 4-hydroxy-3-methylbut-2-enyl diphosphate reductase [Candidatus Aminicenantes bacterium]RLE03604.1 MAG: 4-hydroxy-3-methylbut-2-enyl diphosphate reductase [Candidatus Aminicenantes bacterium]